MARSTSPRKIREWLRRLRRFQESRQSVAEFCRQEGVSQPSFYSWRKRLSSPPIFDCPPARSLSEFRPVRLLPAAGVHVQLPGGTQFVVPLADAGSLQLAIETLARIDANRVGDICPC
jgi:hypothetical protein